MDDFSKIFNLHNEYIKDIDSYELLKKAPLLPSLKDGEFVDKINLNPGIDEFNIDNDRKVINLGEDSLIFNSNDNSIPLVSFENMYNSFQALNSVYEGKSNIKNANRSHGAVYVPFRKKKSINPSVADINYLSRILIDKYNYMNYGKKLYKYNGKIWSRLDFEEFTTNTIDILYEENMIGMSNRNYNELYKRIKVDPAIQVQGEDIPNNSYYLCFRNGVYDLREDRLLKHDPKYIFFTYIDEDFDPKYNYYSNAFDSYLSSITNGIYCIRERMLDVIAYCMSDFSNLKAIPLLVGDRNSGKTTFANLISLIVGPTNCFSINLADFDKWTTACFAGKKVCLSTDLSNDTLSKYVVSQLKQLSGGDLIKAEEKNKDPISFYNQCKIILASNYMPNLPSNDKALEERWLVVPFLKSIEKDNINRNLLNDLRMELPYIINICAKQLRKLVLNDFRFSSIGDLENSFVKDGSYIDFDQDSIINAFIDKKCIISNQERSLLSDLYQSYFDFCIEQYEIDPISTITFSKALRRILGDCVKDGGRTYGRSLIGISLKSNDSI